ncbi:rubrerythrin family protein [Desulfovibrio sp. OttesenSCG-928-A18]|nr:rubrerythrin family protein [Desulfovibrio sp. OttesenSCG-928-A18]
MSVKNAMTADFLRSAYGGESMAHMRYLLWGEHAEKKGFPNIGKLYRAIAYAEQVHAHNHFRALKEHVGGFKVDAGGEFGLRDVADNLAWAIEGERGEVEQMYPVYMQAAEFQGEKEAMRSFHYALEAEKIHVDMFSQAREYALKGGDMPIGSDKIHICPVCGFTHIGQYPDPCPVCKVKSDLFVLF